MAKKKAAEQAEKVAKRTASAVDGATVDWTKPLTPDEALAIAERDYRKALERSVAYINRAICKELPSLKGGGCVLEIAESDVLDHAARLGDARTLKFDLSAWRVDVRDAFDRAGWMVIVRNISGSMFFEIYAGDE